MEAMVHRLEMAERGVLEISDDLVRERSPCWQAPSLGEYLHGVSCSLHGGICLNKRSGPACTLVGAEMRRVFRLRPTADETSTSEG